MRVVVRGWAGAVALGGMVVIAAPVTADEPVDQVRTKEEVEAIVRDYLMREPEVVFEALQELQQRRALAAAEQQREAIVASRDELYRDPETPALGADQPEVTLVEFFDYRCGYCRRVVSTIQALLADEPGLRIVFKELPVLGPESVVAARAALASEAQGGYEDFHFALMEADDLSEESILSIAGQLGLDVARLEEDMNSEEINALIDRNYQLASKLGIEGTPAFVVGDELVPGAVDRQRLEDLIQQARSS